MDVFGSRRGGGSISLKVGWGGGGSTSRLGALNCLSLFFFGKIDK